MEKDTRESRIQALLARMDSGELTAREVLHRLDAIMDSQLRMPRNRANLELLEACEALRRELTHREPTAETARDAARIDAIWDEFRRKSRRKKLLRRSLMVAAVAAAMMVLTFLGSILLERDFLISYDDQDGEVWRFEDIRKRFGLSKEVEANEDEEEIRTSEVNSFSSDEYEAFIDELGYEPLAPPYVPEGWYVTDYHHFNMISVQGYEIDYQNDEEKYLLSYERQDWSGAEIMSVNYEQDPGSGEYRRIRGRKVYCATNMGNRLYIWTEGVVQYSLSGPIEDEEGMRMLEALFDAQDN